LRNSEGESGSVLLLIFAYAGVEIALQPSGEVLTPSRTVPRAIFLALAITFIARRELSGLADGAATAGAQSADEEVLYSSGLAGTELPLSGASARATVSAYLAGRAADHPFLSLDSLASDGHTVTVAISDTVRLPLLGPLAGALPSGGVIRISASASARSLVR
jgi:hypothetical protein